MLIVTGPHLPISLAYWFHAQQRVNDEYSEKQIIEFVTLVHVYNVNGY